MIGQTRAPVDATVVLDIGKTNVKLALLDAGGTLLAEQRMPNAIVREGLYPHHDVERIWDWMLSTIAGFAARARIGAIVPVTHGATAALVDDDGLVLPVLDYEFDLGELDYSARPPFAETLSPDLPCGLNLGRQLAWQAQRHPAQFARAKHILMYPQYWAWRLSGVAASEVTSLGCHTDLWNSVRQTYSSLPEKMGWRTLFAPMQPAWASLGAVKPALARLTGLTEDCQVICGIHDSNASLLRYLGAADSLSGQTVLSTGTWMIAASFGANLDGLREEADMLANTNALGQPVASARFMGGREFGALAGGAPQECGVAELERVIARGTFALPCFAESGGPFAGMAGRIVGPAPETARERYALATLYCVLMTDYCLSALKATGPVVIEGSFSGNPYFAGLLAALRPGATVSTSDDASGTTAGGWMLHHWGEVPAFAARVAPSWKLAGLQEYRARWLALLGALSR